MTLSRLSWIFIPCLRKLRALGLISLRACSVEELGIAPNWLGSTDSKSAGPIYLDRAGVREIGRICLAIVLKINS